MPTGACISKNGTDSFIYRAGVSVVRREDRKRQDETVQQEKPLTAIGIAANAGAFWSAPQSFRGLNPELDAVIDRLRPGKMHCLCRRERKNAAVDALDIGNNLCIGMYRKAGTCGVVREERVRNVAERFYQECGVRPEKRYPQQLSSFEKRLLMLFRCQMQRPEYLVLENPFLNVGDEDWPRLALFAPDGGKRDQASDLYRIDHAGRAAAAVRNGCRKENGGRTDR